MTTFGAVMAPTPRTAVTNGGNGEDRLHGQHGADVLFGGDQDDEVHGRDGVTDNDFVSGGGGTRSMAVAVLVR
jgi:Ca2+-binding RTX toxin-like protein